MRGRHRRRPWRGTGCTNATRAASPRLQRVYPRACGEPNFVRAALFLVTGLSPRVRGTPPYQRARKAVPGSIPARAGNPPRYKMVGADGLVYPRASGGTATIASQHVGQQGLSPRVRGHRRQTALQGRPDGSIPARAGEPLVIKSLNFLEFFTMSKSTERFRSSRFSFCK